MPESLLERSKARSILDKSEVRKDQYVEIPYEGEEKPESLSLVDRATIKKKPKGLMPHFTPEEHKHIHELAEHIRQKFGITGATPTQRTESLFGHLGHGLTQAVRTEIERKKYEMGGVTPTEAVAPSAYAPVRAVPPSMYVRPVEQVVPEEAESAEMPEAEAVIPRRMPSNEILLCRKLRDVV
jgi:hypothetical protein